MCRFHIVKLAPLGDPIEIRLRGYELSLRKQEAAFVFVEKGVRGMTYQFALVGNPNSGKTSTFKPTDGGQANRWELAGVTVERKSGKLRKAKEITIQDLPGIYSLVSLYS